jgi:pre-mRNA-splicing factor ISY1
MHTHESKSIGDIERWRHELIKEITRKIEKIHEVGLTDAQMRDLNDDINFKVNEKRKWEKRVLELGGPDYLRRGNGVQLGDEGAVVPGTKGYRYFGRAKDLPGVRELFEQAAQMQQKITPEELSSRVDADYFGFRDEEDDAIVKHEEERELAELSRFVKNSSEGVLLELRRDFLPEPEPVSRHQLEQWLVKKRQQELANKYSEGVY